MPLIDSIKRFLSGPQGRKLTEQGKRWASDPKNRERAKSLLSRKRKP